MTIFSKIINGEIPSYKIAEDDHFYAFLDVFPLVPGHTLVIPKYEVDKFLDMKDDYLSSVLLFAKPIAQAIERAFPCNRVGLSVVGLEVPHAHLHLVPLNSMNDINFTRGKMKRTPEELKADQEKILKELKKNTTLRQAQGDKSSFQGDKSSL
jgi:histidine triad (HIT) family protein